MITANERQPSPSPQPGPASRDGEEPRAAVETLRCRRARLQEIVSAECEGEGGAPCPSRARCAGYRAVDDVLETVAGLEARLEEMLGGTARDRAALAELAASLRDAAARHEATLRAVSDGVIDVGRGGIVRLLTAAAAAALGVRREDVLGRTLREVPALAALDAALAAGRRDAVVVTLPRGEVLVRAQPYEAGVVATVRELAPEGAPRARAAAPAARYTFDDLVGADPAFVRVLDDARRAARSDVTILVCGESGTGKELLAQAIHNASARASEPFLGVNVTAIPRELLESELFGYEAGAFTGARPGGRPGKFELAGRGTLLLDELADMPLELQSKLLRVLQEKLVPRLGGSREAPVRARVIATSDRDLGEAVSRGRFRLDLFHRLCVVVLRLPPLRERRSDVPLLVEHHLRQHAIRERRRVGIAPHVMAALRAHDWPGNVRQLLNVIDAEISLLPPGVDELTRVPPGLPSPRPRPGLRAADELAPLTLDDLERRACDEALATCGGNVARAARALGIAKGTLYAKMRRYGIAAAPPGVAHAGAAPAPASGHAGKWEIRTWGAGSRPHPPNRAPPVASRRGRVD